MAWTILLKYTLKTSAISNSILYKFCTMKKKKQTKKFFLKTQNGQICITAILMHLLFQNHWKITVVRTYEWLSETPAYKISFYKRKKNVKDYEINEIDTSVRKWNLHWTENLLYINWK